MKLLNIGSYMKLSFILNIKIILFLQNYPIFLKKSKIFTKISKYFSKTGKMIFFPDDILLNYLKLGRILK